MEPVQTFWCEWTGLVRVSLRRFTFSRSPDGDRGIGCPAFEVDDDGYQNGHDASNLAYDTAPVRQNADGYYEVWPVAEFGLDHELWPTVCESCGDPFPSEAEFQVNQDEWLIAPNIGQWTQRNVPTGACFDSWWMPKGDDGISLTVVCPPGDLASQWCVDGPASNGGHWTREGDPKECNVTANPSIQTHAWHGWLKSGLLTEV